MTAVNRSTGEVVEVLSEIEASRLTNRIRIALTAMLDRRDKVLGLIAEAKTGAAHDALGYASWTDYVKNEFAGALPRLSSDERKPVVSALSSMGMSTRAIGSVTGVDQKTVSNDLRSGEENSSPDPDPDVLDAEIVDDETPAPTTPQGEPVSRDVGAGQPPEPQRTTGVDGKSYPRPAPKPLQMSPDELRASQRRAGVANLTSVLTHLVSRSLSPDELAARYEWLLDEFELVDLTYAARTMTAIANHKERMTR